MLKFSIKIEDLDDVKTFLTHANTDYISVLATPYGAYFIANSLGLYMQYRFNIIDSVNLDELQIFRLSRKDLIGLILEGFIKFSINIDEVKVSFRNKSNKEIYNMKSKYQIDTADEYLRIMDIIEEAQSYPEFNFTSILQLVRFSNTLNRDITCYKGKAFIETKNVSIFKNVQLPDFCCVGKNLSLLSHYTTKVRNVQNYLIYVGTEISIVITKSKMVSEPSIDYIKKVKQHYLVSFTLSKMLGLSKRLRLNDGELIFDIKHNKVTYKTELSSYSSDIGIIDAKSCKKQKEETPSQDTDLELSDLGSLDFSGNASLDLESITDSGEIFPVFYIPCDILNKILAYIPVDQRLQMLISKNIIVIKANNLFITFGRRDYSE